MTIDFYCSLSSPPCRAVQMAAKAAGVELNLKITNTRTGEHLKPEFLKMNPQHTIPTIDDNGFYLYESRAIMMYLADQYGPDSLYPKDPKKRAIVNHRLYFDLATMYQSCADYYYPRLFTGRGFVVTENFDKVEKALEIFETFVKDSEYVAGNEFTLADIALLATISSYSHEDGGFSLASYPNVAEWFNRCKKIAPGYDINEKGLVEFKKYFALAGLKK